MHSGGRILRGAPIFHVLLLPPSAPSPHLMPMLLPQITLPKYTIADLDTFPDDGQRYELLQGFLLVTPAPGAPHQVVAVRLMTALMNCVSDLAFVTGPGVVEREPDIHLEPDVLVFPKPMPPSQKWKDLSGHWLAVEVYSLGSRKYDHDYKRDAYLALGVREVWLVDLDERVVLISRADGLRDEGVTNTLRWHPSEVAVELVLPLERLFADL